MYIMVGNGSFDEVKIQILLTIKKPYDTNGKNIK